MQELEAAIREATIRALMAFWRLRATKASPGLEYFRCVDAATRFEDKLKDPAND